MAASESYPEGLLYNAEHDWARIEGDEAVLGITWYAADSLGDLVHYEPPAPGAAVEKGRSYGEGWLIRIRLTDPSERDSLLDVDAYRTVVAES